MNVLVNGGGNIGTTLCNVLLTFKQELGISTVLLKKNSDRLWQLADLDLLKEQGVTIIPHTENLTKILSNVDYVFDATSNKTGLANQKKYYANFSHLKAVAQGSEKGFGVPFVSGLNNHKIQDVPFVQVVSCNTHGAAALLQTFSEGDFNNIQSADFVVVRRSEDIGNHERLVTANVVARHLDETIGTHHAIDVTDTLKTIGVNIPITSSDITTPSQLMHATRFNITLKNNITKQEVLALIANNKLIAQTNKFDSNLIFELGRRYGFQGRIYNQAIVVSNNILVQKNTIKGWAFIPQEGNTIISTIHAFLLQNNAPNEKAIITKITKKLLRANW